MGNLATIQPMLSPMLWTSIATGKRPAKHGVHGFVEPLPDGGRAVRPVTTLEPVRPRRSGTSSTQSGPHGPLGGRLVAVELPGRADPAA